MKLVERERERERESHELLRFTPSWDMKYSEPYFFALLPRGWDRADLKRLFIFVSSSFWGHTRFRHSRVRYILTFLYLSTRCRLVPAPRACVQSGVKSGLFALCPICLTLLGVENLRPYIFFGRLHMYTIQHPTNAIQVAFSLSLVYLKTQLHSVFEIH